MANSNNVKLINFAPNYQRRIQARKPKDKQFVVECAYCYIATIPGETQM